MAEGNYLKKKRKHIYLSADCRYFIERLAKYRGLSEGGVIEQAVRDLHEKLLGPYKWDDPLDPRPRQDEYRVKREKL